MQTFPEASFTENKIVNVTAISCHIQSHRIRGAFYSSSDTSSCSFSFYMFLGWQNEKVKVISSTLSSSLFINFFFVVFFVFFPRPAIFPSTTRLRFLKNLIAIFLKQAQFDWMRNLKLVVNYSVYTEVRYDGHLFSGDTIEKKFFTDEKYFIDQNLSRLIIYKD